MTSYSKAYLLLAFSIAAGIFMKNIRERIALKILKIPLTLQYKVLFILNFTIHIKMTIQIRRRISIGIGILFLLSIPLISMQFTDEVNWQLGDFLIMGTALVVLGFLFEFIASRSEKWVYRVATGIGLLGAFLLFWVNGAVGIIGNEGQPANLLYISIFAIGFIGAIISGFKAKGMAITLFIAAGVQVLIPALALLIWGTEDISWSPGIFGVFILSSFFALLFLISGLLFRKATKD